MGFVEYLTLIFAIFKLAGVLDWSWWVVFSPMLIFYGGVMAFALLLVFLQLVILFFQLLSDEWGAVISTLRRKR